MLFRKPQSESQVLGEAAATYAELVARQAPNTTTRTRYDDDTLGMSIYRKIVRHDAITTTVQQVPDVGEVSLSIEDERIRAPLGHFLTVGAAAAVGALMRADERLHGQPLSSLRTYSVDVAKPDGHTLQARFSDVDFWPPEYWTTPEQRCSPDFQALSGTETVRVLHQTIQHLEARPRQ